MHLVLVLMNYNEPDFVLYLSSVVTTTGLYDKNLHVLDWQL